MRSVFILTLLLLVTKISHAQNWCAPGAEWLYRVYQGGYLFPQDGFLRIKVDSSYMQGGNSYHVLNGTFYGHQGAPNSPTVMVSNRYRATTYESNKVVYVSRRDHPIFDTLANFNASIGDKWLKVDLYNDCAPSYTPGIHLRYVTVIDTGHIIINNISLKKLILGLHPSSVTSNTIMMVEKIGSLNGFMHPYVICISDHWNLGEFSCYSDTNFPTYKNPNYTLACDYRTVGKTEFTLKGMELNVFPNPASDHIRIEFSGENVPEQFQVQVFDLLGKLVLSATYSSGSSLDLTHIKEGLYTINLVSEGQVLAIRKLVVALQ